MFTLLILLNYYHKSIIILTHFFFHFYPDEPYKYIRYLTFNTLNVELIFNKNRYISQLFFKYYKL